MHGKTLAKETVIFIWELCKINLLWKALPIVFKLDKIFNLS